LRRCATIRRQSPQAEAKHGGWDGKPLKSDGPSQTQQGARRNAGPPPLGPWAGSQQQAAAAPDRRGAITRRAHARAGAHQRRHAASFRLGMLRCCDAAILRESRRRTSRRRLAIPHTRPACCLSGCAASPICSAVRCLLVGGEWAVGAGCLRGGRAWQGGRAAGRQERAVTGRLLQCSLLLQRQANDDGMWAIRAMGH
jgi:hypothetical protein